MSDDNLELNCRKRILLVRSTICVTIVAAGVGGMLLLASFKRAPDQKAYSEFSQRVDVVEAEFKEINISTVEYGTAQPLREVVLSSEAPGRIRSINPDLKSGTIVDKGNILVQIDPVYYQIALTKLQSDFARLEADVHHSEVSHANELVRLEALKKDYEISEKALKRQKMLFDKDAVPETEVDRAEQETAQKKSLYLALSNSVELFPYRMKALKSKLESSRSSVEEAQLILERCTVKAPFSGRLTSVDVEQNQYVRQGDKLLTIADESTLEIPVSIAGTSALKLGLRGRTSQGDRYYLKGADNISASIRWVESASNQLIGGDVVRVEGYHPDSRTVKLIVRPKNTGKFTPLVAGMFCRIELSGKRTKRLIAIPRSAIQFGGKIFSVDGESRLHQRSVTIYHRDEAMFYLESGIEDGELIVTSKLPFGLVDGMKVSFSKTERLR